jgi:hypothetical protein
VSPEHRRRRGRAAAAAGGSVLHRWAAARGGKGGQGVALSGQEGHRPKAGSRTGSPPARLAAPLPMFLGRGREQRGKEKQRRPHL